MKQTNNSQADLAKKSLSRPLAAILLITGIVAVLSAIASFAFHIIVPIAAVLILGILIARTALHSQAPKSESIGRDLRRFSLETASEAAKVAGESTQSTTATFRQKPKKMRIMAPTSEIEGSPHEIHP